MIFILLCRRTETKHGDILTRTRREQSENPQQSTISITIRSIDQNSEGEDELIKVTRHPNE